MGQMKIIIIMIDLKISIIRINANGINWPVKRERLTNWENANKFILLEVH